MFRTTILLLILILTAGTAMAQYAPKQISAGAGVYVVTSKTGDHERDNMVGHAFTAAMTLGPGSAVRGHLYFTKPEEEDAGDFKLDGYDAQFLLGSNLNRKGGKIYVLGGYWSETMKEDSSSKTQSAELDFSGFMAGLGIGYNWPSATLDLWVAWRDPADYKDIAQTVTGVEPDIEMGAGALTFALRF